MTRMSNAFVERLRGYGVLSEEDADTLTAACHNIRNLPAGHHLIREGDRPDPVFVILEGWACRYKILPDGGRQIIAFMLPGDFCDIHIAVLEEMDHNIVTLTPAKIAAIPRAQMEELIETKPSMTRAFWWAQLVDEGVLRSWIVSMGRRKSVERVAHLMCELYVRMRNVGLANADRCEIPLTQIVLADSLGMTPVHTNRVIKKLRLDGAMELQGGHLSILDPAKLARIAGFDDNYLHSKLKHAARTESGMIGIEQKYG
jgi:CRP-like cAMP-binding protein